ncbi:MAG: tRNA dihydrouridine synthase DusB [Hyphomicrobiales bacterium]|nr:tRNA dihydrouridine synthase DusB [Hyphomicrobiales bacterium]
MRFGPFKLASCAVLAPMAGITDPGMRRLAMRFGAGIAVAEMAGARFLIEAERGAMQRMQRVGFPHVVQIAGRDPDALAQAARIAEDAGADAIDINMGCPAQRVVGGGMAGAALMTEPALAAELVRAVVAAVSRPVSVKMRLGWDDSLRNAPEIARIAEGEGAAWLTVHGRTRQQFYKGSADWAAIRAVREAVQLPLIANGDCSSAADARAMLAQSGADAVMIGRAAVGRPWLVGEIGAALEGRAAPVLSPHDKFVAARAHYETLLDLFGVAQGVRHARKHLAAYVQEAAHEGAGLNDAGRARLVTTLEPREALDLLEAAFLGPACDGVAA